MAPHSPTLATEGLAIGYRNRRRQTVVAADLELRLWPGELVCLLGPNGAGKSTLMRTIAGMQPALAGRVLLNGVDLRQQKPAAIARQLSVVLTEKVDTGLLPAYGVVALGRYPYTDWQGRLTARDEQIVQEALAAVGATALADRPVTELSDGERQKVMIARALAQEPKLMLLDEPTAYLDLPRRVETMQILRGLAQAERCAILLSTHDLDLALRSADQIWLLHDGQLLSGMPEELVLQGRFAETFAADGITFDRLSGSFQVGQSAGISLFVVGEDAEAVWCRRALTRVGYRLATVPDGAMAEIRYGRSGWQIEATGFRETTGSLGEMLQLVQNRFPPRSAQ